MKVLYHGNCFDGCVSAALFSAFYEQKFGPVSGYHGLTHGPNGPLSEGLFDGEENAIVDFRYAESPNLPGGLIIIGRFLFPRGESIFVLALSSCSMTRHPPVQG